LGGCDDEEGSRARTTTNVNVIVHASFTTFLDQFVVLFLVLPVKRTKCVTLTRITASVIAVRSACMHLGSIFRLGDTIPLPQLSDRPTCGRRNLAGHRTYQRRSAIDEYFLMYSRRMDLSESTDIDVSCQRAIHSRVCFPRSCSPSSQFAHHCASLEWLDHQASGGTFLQAPTDRISPAPGLKGRQLPRDPAI
jgi:hypothetical protein